MLEQVGKVDSLTVEDVRCLLDGGSLAPQFVHGDALEVLRKLPDGIVDCCVTSPPYWGHRKYASRGLGEERDWQAYVERLCLIIAEVRRVLKPVGSLWLNLGDSYHEKCLVGIPWRVALRLIDDQTWVLRNSVIWNKVKGGPDNSKDKLRCVHELVFHFVKQSRGYYYDVDAIRKPAGSSKVVKGAVVSATGVSGVRYKRQIELSTLLTETEKRDALASLQAVLADVQQGRVSDFRMIIRGAQRTTHSDSGAVSGRAKELQKRGFYFLKYHPNGTKPSDVWDILPEDSHGREEHYAPFPVDLCRLPILATCPPKGIVLDPFCGTGTTCVAALRLGRRSMGIDVSESYLRTARNRCALHEGMFDGQ